MRSLRLFSCALLVAAAPGLASAMPQPRQAEHRRGFKLYSGSLAAGVDRGIVLDDGTNIEDNTLTFIPMAIAYRSQSPRSDLQFIYEPAFDIFDTHTELNALNHAAAGAYSFNATRDFDFQASGSFLRTHDRNRQSSGLIISPYGLYIEGRAYVSIGYRLNRDTRVNTGVNSSLIQTASLASASASGSIDELISSFTASLARSFGSMHQVSVGYAHLVSTLLNSEDLPAGGNISAQQGQGALNIGYTLSVASGLRLAASAGAIRLPQEVGDDQYTYSWFGRLDKSWSSLTIGVRYERSLSGLLQLDAANPANQVRDPLLSRSVAEQAEITLSGQFGRRLRTDTQIGLFRTFLRSSDERLEAIYAGVSAEFVLAERVVPFVSFRYWDQNTTEFARPVLRRRIMAGLRFYWDSPGTIPALSGHESVRSILPGRRSRR